jgi:hypothetical protein
MTFIISHGLVDKADTSAAVFLHVPFKQYVRYGRWTVTYRMTLIRGHHPAAVSLYASSML